MCVAYMAIQANPDWPLFIAANRDEFHQRAALPAAPWPGHPRVIAGIDCAGRGTWLGVTLQGRFGLLTNYRDPSHVKPTAPSRGKLLADYLTGDMEPGPYARHIADTGAIYNGFNLVVGNLRHTYYVGNRSPTPAPQALTPGRYVLSNHLLDTPWPKVQRLRSALDHFDLDQMDMTLDPLFEILKDGTQAQEHVLPDTGLSRERERLLSSPFIISPDYGTRCSTIVAIHASGRALLSEISYDPAGTATERHDWPFHLETQSLARN